MSRYTTGWIKLWRSVDQHWIGRDGIALAVWSKIMLWACREPTRAMFDGSLVDLRPGQLLTSTRELATALRFDRKAVERRLDLLEADRSVVQQKGHDGRIITIENWPEYQGDEKNGGPPTGHSEDRRRDRHEDTQRDTQGALIEEERREKGEEIYPGPSGPGESSAPELPKSKKPPSRRRPEPSSFDVQIAHDWANHARSIDPKLKINFDAWAEVFRLLREQDGMTEEDIRAVFEFVKGDWSFWRANAISPMGLRTRSKNNGLLKVENIRNAMRRDGVIDGGAGCDPYAAFLAETEEHHP